MNRPVHFEIHVDDMERAQKFYGEIFGWKFQKWEGSPTEYSMVMTGDGPGINGGMLKRNAPIPAEGSPNAFVITMDVSNIDETIKKIEAAGAMAQMPKFAMPGMAWLAYYKDLEGNIFGIYQEDKNAK